MDKEEKLKRELARQKATGYAAQKRYRERHPEKTRQYRKKQKEREKGTVYEPKIRLKIEYKQALLDLLSETELSITDLCLGAVEEKYGVVLRKKD